jgi:putative transposase
MKAKHKRVARDIEHKIARAVVEVAVAPRGHPKAGTIVYGDVRDIADGVDHGKLHNQQSSQWNHGQIQKFVEYKAEAEGIAVVLQNERNTSKTCPNCGHRHKPRGRNYRCPACKFGCPLGAHRDVVGQINILSAYKLGEPGKIPAPEVIKHREPYQIRSTRRCRDTGQT